MYKTAKITHLADYQAMVIPSIKQFVNMVETILISDVVFVSFAAIFVLELPGD